MERLAIGSEYKHALHYFTRTLIITLRAGDFCSAARGCCSSEPTIPSQWSDHHSTNFFCHRDHYVASNRHIIFVVHVTAFSQITAIARA
jgi:hypothetical protein